MATKSFTTDFEFNRKSSSKLIHAFENSKEVKYSINKKVTEVSDKEGIDHIMSSFLGRD